MTLFNRTDVTTPGNVATTVASTAAMPTTKIATINPSELSTTERAGAATTGQGAMMSTASAAEGASVATTAGPVVLPSKMSFYGGAHSSFESVVSRDELIVNFPDPYRSGELRDF